MIRGHLSTEDWWSLLSVPASVSLSLLQQVILVLSVVVSGLLGIYGFRLWMLTLYAVRRKIPPQASSPQVWPSVSVHVPVYNEKTVISRLLDSVLAFDYPRDKLHVIVIDDSDDGTTDLLRSYERQNPAIVKVVHRNQRAGFKAGALQVALAGSDSEFLALFDADQVPPANFLRRMIPYLWHDKTVAFAQGRPSYLNDKSSWVARALALGLDSFAFVEQEARFSADLLTHFGGGGAVFRKAAIVDSGGWESETLAEDLDLSIRLRLNGWHYVYDSSVTCPGEIPTSFPILQRQQFRWASGFVGCLRKHFRTLMTSRELTFMQKGEAINYLTGYVASPLIASGVVLVIMYCLIFPVDFILRGFQLNPLAAFTVLMSALIYSAPLASFALAAFRSRSQWSRRAERVVDLICLGVLSVGIFLTSARAIVAGLLNRATYFYRTPKIGDAVSRTIGRGGSN